MPCWEKSSLALQKSSLDSKRALLGMQPMRRHVPPRSCSFSTQPTFRPNCAARMAATYPPGPAPMMTRSCCFCSTSNFEQNPRRILEQPLDVPEKGDRFAAVDDAVVVSERHVHHRTNDNCPFSDNGSFLNRVHPEDATLRRVYDRRRKQRTVDAAVGNRKGAAPKFIEIELVGFGPAREIVNGALDLGEAHAFGVAEHWNHEAPAAADGDADVIVVAIDDISAAHFGIDLRDELERLDRSLDEERHEAELDGIFLLKRLPVLPA